MSETATAKQRKRKPTQKSGDETKRQPKSRFRANSDTASLLGVLLPLLVTLIGLGLLYWRNNSVAPSPEAPLSEKPPPFDVVDLPGRGKGAIASRDIAQGERLITEKPLFVIPHEIHEDPVAFLRRHLSKVTKEEEESYWALSHHAVDSKTTTSQKYQDEKVLSIFQTNGISAGPDRVGIFPRTARLNHGCVAAFNSVYSWREDEQILVTHALRPIKKGEELLTTYFRSRQPRADRQAHLLNQYHFKCECSHCSLWRHKINESDQRITKINGLYARFAQWQNDAIEGREAAVIVIDIWRLTEEEGYWSERGQLAADMAHVAAGHTDEEATSAWATLASKWFSYELGSDSQQVQQMKSIIAHPKSHSNWGTRKHLLVGLPTSDLR